MLKCESPECNRLGSASQLPLPESMQTACFCLLLSQLLMHSSSAFTTALSNIKLRMTPAHTVALRMAAESSSDEEILVSRRSALQTAAAAVLAVPCRYKTYHCACRARFCEVQHVPYKKLAPLLHIAFTHSALAQSSDGAFTVTFQDGPIGLELLDSRVSACSVAIRNIIPGTQVKAVQSQAVLLLVL
jgi:hypothetical protein